jgi:tRNA (adenine37-N6)-methyltransferase
MKEVRRGFPGRWGDASVNKDRDMRPRERRADLDAATDAQLRFIGKIRTPFADRDACPRQGRPDGPECRLVLDPVWRPALQGLEAFDTIEVLYWLDRSRRDLMTQNPRHDDRVYGTFALRSPVRPNPIGTSIVRLVRIEDGVVVVRGLDCIDGTPLLDIKPDRCAFSPRAPTKPADG